MNTWVIRSALGILAVVVVGLLIFLFMQDSHQHGVVQSSMDQANDLINKMDKGSASKQTATLQYLFYKAQFAESDRQEVVLFVIGIGTIAATILGAVALLARKETPQPGRDNPRALTQTSPTD